MTLRGTYFGRVLNASGAQGFFQEGYAYHDWFEAIPGFGFENTTFVAKTTTLLQRDGNMPLKDDGITPTEFKPKCIIVKPFKGVVLNAVGLSGPGFKFLLDDGRWQRRQSPFLLSFMSIGETIEERLDQYKQASTLLSGYRCGFQSPFGWELNFSCPNVKANYDDLINEIGRSLVIAGRVGVPLVVKINALVPPKDALRIAEYDLCDALCVSNTIPWGQLPEQIKWKKIFGSDTSPLAHLGGGGLSGKPLLKIVSRWIREARQAGLTKPIIGGGGILSPDDAVTMINAGADAISLGSIAILRPWKMAQTIQTARTCFDQEME